MTVTGRPIGPDDVEGFFARQARQIGAAVRQEAATRRAAAASGRAWLAAAASLALVAAALAWRVSPPPSSSAVWSDLLAALDASDADLPLTAYGWWETQEEAGAAVDDASGRAEAEEIGSLPWLLEGGDRPAIDPVPEFLEPFGAWDAGDAEGGAT